MMTNANWAALNQDELLRMALNAGVDGATAIACLQEAAGLPDATAMTHYVLGAEYAQAQRYGDAIAALETALALDPALHVARLQLGMLYLGALDETRAVATLAALEALDDLNPLRHFAGGLLMLTRGEPAAALASLERGAGLNVDLPALNADMRRIMRELAPQDTAAAAEEGARHVLLSAYTFNRTH